MKRKYADERNNTDIIESEFKSNVVNNNDFTGNVTFLKIKKVKNKWFVDEEKRCILDENYTWVGIYPEHENYCITAIYDENKNIKEWYFDISKHNGIENGIPYEDDLYLDIVILPDGRVNILDEDELIQAYHDKNITKKDYELAYKVKDKIINEFANNVEKLKNICL